MPREVKFRAWNDEHKMMSEPFTLMDALTGKTSGADFRGSILRQWTGLHDKNGKPIYEGDVCKFKSYGKVSVVCWDNERAHFELRGITNGEPDEVDADYFSDSIFGINDDPWRETVEVIGNIYENPELLKDHA